jgi:hypothetical protein
VDNGQWRQRDRLSGLSDDAWKGVPKGVFPQAFQLQEHPRIMWNAKKLSYACKKFVERQNCDATILQGTVSFVQEIPGQKGLNPL